MSDLNTGRSRERYTNAEIYCIESHIEEHIGIFDDVFHEHISPDIHVDLAIVKPTEEKPYYTVVTMGMGAHCMNVPENFKDEKLERAELMVCLPPDWVLKDTEMRWFWPLQWLKVMARFPIISDTWLAWGRSIPNNAPFAENTELCAFVVLSPGAFEEAANRCELPSGETVNFYQIVPLYAEELDFKVENGTSALLDLMNDKLLTVVDPARKNACAFLKGKKWAIPQADIKDVLDWEGPDSCLATDKILVEGKKVGYMYREEPSDSLPDSGWRFTAGDETVEYMSDPELSGFYNLNIVCNYDSDIIPYLSAPVGSAFVRGKNGKFKKLKQKSSEK